MSGSRPAYAQAQEDYAKHKALHDHAQTLNDAIFIANTKEAKRELDGLGLFKGDLAKFTRYYEFTSQIYDYDSNDLERLSLYARHLASPRASPQ